MIFGIGCDIVNVQRLKKFNPSHFARRIFSTEELKVFEKKALADDTARLLYLAKRFAAKEAVSKALGTGFVNGLHLSDIEIFNDEKGKPYAQITESFLPNNNARIHLSLSDDKPYAMAIAVIELNEPITLNNI